MQSGDVVPNSFTPLVGFRSEKAAQISAFFAHAWGGRIDKLALAKLVYIAERESVRLRNRPMIYDECFSLKDGPICKSALDGMNGNIDVDIWSKYIQTNGPKDVYSVRDVTCDLDQISESDLSVLESIVSEHKGKTGSQMRSWTHASKNVPEYTEVTGTQRFPISYADMAAGVDTRHPEDVAETVRSHRLLEKMFPSK